VKNYKAIIRYNGEAVNAIDLVNQDVESKLVVIDQHTIDSLLQMIPEGPESFEDYAIKRMDRLYRDLRDTDSMNANEVMATINYTVDRIKSKYHLAYVIDTLNSIDQVDGEPNEPSYE
jgi:hypothetical protein